MIIVDRRVFLNLLTVVQLGSLAVLVDRWHVVLVLDGLYLLIVFFMNRCLLWECASHKGPITAEFALIFLTFNLLLFQIVYQFI